MCRIGDAVNIEKMKMSLLAIGWSRGQQAISGTVLIGLEIPDKGSSYVKPLARGVRNRVEAKKISLHDIEYIDAEISSFTSTPIIPFLLQPYPLNPSIPLS